MGQASSAASSTSAIYKMGAGGLTVNKPNYSAWIVGGIVAILALFVWLKKGRR
jgi:hypothetical protein